MIYLCPECKSSIDQDLSFQIGGQCQCDHCGAIVDLNSAVEGPLETDEWDVDETDNC